MDFIITSKNGSLPVQLIKEGNAEVFNGVLPVDIYRFLLQVSKMEISEELQMVWFLTIDRKGVTYTITIK
jgi:hypothetical protein